MAKDEEELDLKKPEDLEAALAFFTLAVKTTNKKRKPPTQQAQDQATGEGGQESGKNDHNATE